MRTLFLSLVAVLFLAPLCRAQTLADRIPDDALLYVGWSGVDSPPAGYAQSHLKAVLDASQIREFLNETVPSLIPLATRSDPSNEPIVRKTMTVLGILARHPSALYFAAPDPGSNPNMPIPKQALLCDAGDDAALLVSTCNDAINTANAANTVFCRQEGSLVIITDVPMPVPAKPLSKNEKFLAEMSVLDKDPMAAVYVDVHGLTEYTDALFKKFGTPDVVQSWNTARQSLGLDSYLTYSATAGFSGKNWSMQATLRTDGRLPAMSTPLSAALLKLIPDTVVTASAGNLDVHADVAAILAAVHSFSPQYDQQAQQMLSQINQMLGLDVQEDLLAPLGSQWAIYSDPATTGGGLLGTVLLNRPNDPARLEASLTKIETFANNMVASQSPQTPLEFRQTDIDGLHLHYWATPGVSPSLVIHDGTLFVGLFPQTVVAAASRGADGKSILDNTSFQNLRKTIGAPEQFCAFRYTDVPRTFAQNYTIGLVMARIFPGIADLVGAKIPPLLLPPLDKITPELEPAAAFCWVDGNAVRARSIAPFPGAAALGATAYLTASSGALMAIGMFQDHHIIGSDTAAAGTVHNLKMIHESCMLYAGNNRDDCPSSLGDLAKNEGTSSSAFLSTYSNVQVPPNMTADQQADWINANSEFIYLGAGLKFSSLKPDQVLLYEKDGLEPNGNYILFGDGHVELLSAGDAHAAIDKTKAALGR